MLSEDFNENSISELPSLACIRPHLNLGLTLFFCVGFYCIVQYGKSDKRKVKAEPSTIVPEWLKYLRVLEKLGICDPTFRDRMDTWFLITENNSPAVRHKAEFQLYSPMNNQHGSFPGL